MLVYVGAKPGEKEEGVELLGQPMKPNDEGFDRAYIYAAQSMRDLEAWARLVADGLQVGMPDIPVPAEAIVAVLTAFDTPCAGAPKDANKRRDAGMEAMRPFLPAISAAAYQDVVMERDGDGFLLRPVDKPDLPFMVFSPRMNADQPEIHGGHLGGAIIVFVEEDRQKDMIAMLRTFGYTDGVLEIRAS